MGNFDRRELGKMIDVYCRICRNLITDYEDTMYFSELGGMERHLLYGARVHQNCLDNWEGIDEYIVQWNRNMAESAGRIRYLKKVGSHVVFVSALEHENDRE